MKELGRMHNPPHPGEVLKGLYMEGRTVTEIAQHLNVTRKTLSQLVNAKQDVTPEMAFRLGKGFDTDPEMWMNMQKNYDLWQIESTTKEFLQPVTRIPSVDHIPS